MIVVVGDSVRLQFERSLGWGDETVLLKYIEVYYTAEQFAFLIGFLRWILKLLYLAYFLLEILLVLQAEFLLLDVFSFLLFLL